MYKARQQNNYDKYGFCCDDIEVYYDELKKVINYNDRFREYYIKYRKIWVVKMFINV